MARWSECGECGGPMLPGAAHICRTRSRPARVPPEVATRYLALALAQQGYVDAEPWRDSEGWCCDLDGEEYHTTTHDWREAASLLADRIGER